MCFSVRLESYSDLGHLTRPCPISLLPLSYLLITRRLELLADRMSESKIEASQLLTRNLNEAVLSKVDGK